MDPLFATIPEVCAMLSVGRSTIYQKINSHELEVAKVGRRTLITVASVKIFAERAVARAKS